MRTHLLAALLLVCSPVAPILPEEDSGAAAKISFDLSKISPAGLVGPPNGLRSLAYEFCIPAQASYRAQVQAIDATVQFYPGSRGRIGCRPDQYLCIGNTHQVGWRQKLLQLANLPYIQRIDEAVFE